MHRHLTLTSPLRKLGSNRSSKLSQMASKSVRAGVCARAERRQQENRPRASSKFHVSESAHTQMQQAAAGAAGALAAVSLAASNALGASLTYDELQGLTYKEVKGTGIANECPLVDNKNAQSDLSSLNPGEYSLQQFCMEPTKFQVQEDESKGFQDTKLMTRLTYTLDGMTGKFKYGRDGKIGIEESEGIDYAATTVKLPGGDKVPFLFSMKSLKAEGKADDIKGEFNVPSYRGATFLDPKGRGEVTGYDNAVALPAKSDDEELSKENAKSTAPSKGNARFRVTAYNPETKEVGGVFESLQPSDTDLGAKTPKDVKVQGVWYSRLSDESA